jgi:serine/threonine protein phosphatase PrpC
MSQFQIESEIESTINVPVINVSKITGSKRDLGAGQDLIFFGKEEEYEWGALLDGHGSRIFNYFKKLAERQDWVNIMKAERPDLALIESLQKSEPDFSSNTSGATMSLMKAFPNRIETMNIGDSQTAIYKNGKLVYINTPHNRKNQAEITRLETRVMNYEPSPYPTPYIVEAGKMRLKDTEYCIFEDGTKLAMSQSLGHNHITGYDAEVHIELFEDGDKMRVVMGSDGLFDMIIKEEDGENEIDTRQDLLDMLNMSAEDLLDKVEARWKQDWFLYDGTEKGCVTSYPKNMLDDISVIIWDNSNSV